MPSIEESKAQVKAAMSNSTTPSIDHDAILADLQDEIDRHNAENHNTESHEASGPSSSDKRFRFKSSQSDPRKRKSHRHHDSTHPKRRRHHNSTTTPSTSTPAGTDEPTTSAHPFPREPTSPSLAPHLSSATAFRESLFDALADDEGAAYWEAVYSQPIHVYARPWVATGGGGDGFEEMDDEAYAAYVRTKMWEAKNPQVVWERERAARRAKEEEAERERRKEEFVRRRERERERAAWEERRDGGGRRDRGSEGFEYVFDFEGRTGGASKREEMDDEVFAKAWERYLAKWDGLKLDRPRGEEQGTEATLQRRIAWPVLHKGDAVDKQNVERFMQHAPRRNGDNNAAGGRLQMLKAERVRWHPDKMQQRFGEAVDTEMLKKVTAVFQIIDGLVEKERLAKGG